MLERTCAECGFDAAAVDRAAVGDRIRAGLPRWSAVLGPGAAARPAAEVWSPLEYACHVRDVHRVFGERVALVLAEDDPEFPNWDQDETALADDYAGQDPSTVAAELAEAAHAVATAYDALDPHDERLWSRPARRSNGSLFTLDSLARYHLHDVEHHVWDVRGVRA